MDTKERKVKIRNDLLERRSSIPKQGYLQKSYQICARLRNLPEYRKAQNIHCYISMNARREVNTHPLLKEMLVEGKKVVVPVTQTDSRTMRHIALSKFEDLQPNTWGVLEPSGGEEVLVGSLDLIIIPMVGGDRHKNRIGYGKGFYDRFLAEVDCPKIGLLFEDCLIDEVPTESFDVPLNALITETKVVL